jgi:hypothetical protein
MVGSLRYPLSFNTIYNIGNDQLISTIEIARTLSSIMDRSMRVKRLPSPPADEPFRIRIDHRKSQCIFGRHEPLTTIMSTPTSIHIGLVQTLEWLIRHAKLVKQTVAEAVADANKHPLAWITPLPPSSSPTSPMILTHTNSERDRFTSLAVAATTTWGSTLLKAPSLLPLPWNIKGSTKRTLITICALHPPLTDIPPSSEPTTTATSSSTETPSNSKVPGRDGVGPPLETNTLLYPELSYRRLESLLHSLLVNHDNDVADIIVMDAHHPESGLAQRLSGMNIKVVPVVAVKFMTGGDSWQLSFDDSPTRMDHATLIDMFNMAWDMFKQGKYQHWISVTSNTLIPHGVIQQLTSLLDDHGGVIAPMSVRSSMTSRYHQLAIETVYNIHDQDAMGGWIRDYHQYQTVQRVLDVAFMNGSIIAPVHELPPHCFAMNAQIQSLEIDNGRGHLFDDYTNDAHESARDLTLRLQRLGISEITLCTSCFVHHTPVVPP